MIEREEIRFVAAADYTDDCRVTVELRKRRMTVTITEAEQLRAELDAAICEAKAGAEGLLLMSPPARFDVAHISPDCRDGKCGACVGTAWDVDADDLTGCTCACHTEAVAA